MALRIVQVDAFTDTPFRGNPAAVCVLPAPRDAPWMQNVAREMNLSETAFLHGERDGWSLRWFTPTVEVALCGHLLTADRRGAWIELDFPAKSEAPAPAPAGLSEALGAAPKYVGRNQFDYLVELDSEKSVRDLTPDHATLAKLPVRGVIVTSHASGDYDFVSRFFAPASGIAEDPVTGSSHCALGPFWSARLGKPELLAYQASPRGGVVRVRVVGDRVKLGGQAVTVLRGELV